MKQKSKTIIGISCSAVLILVFVFFIKNNNLYDSYEESSFVNVTNPEFSLGEPYKHEESFRLGNWGGTFINYEDFPIQIPIGTSYTDLKIINIPNGIWGKIIQNKENSSSNQFTVLRIMGAVKPLAPTKFNGTLFLSVFDYNKNMSYVTTTSIMQNRILEEISPVRTSVPVKFKNEMFSYSNSTITHILGIVYDNDPMYNFSIDANSTNSLYVNIIPLGIMYNGSLEDFPPWMKVEVFNLPKTLNQNQPTFYLIRITTTNAPVGSYQIALRETIGSEKFVETMTDTVIE